MSLDDLEINLIQYPIKDNPKQTILKSKKLKFKKSKQASATQVRQTRSKKQDDKDDDVIIIGSSKPSQIPLSKKTISKRRVQQQKKNKISSKQKCKSKNSKIKDLILDWQKDIRKMIECTVVLSNKISQLD